MISSYDRPLFTTADRITDFEEVVRLDTEYISKKDYAWLIYKWSWKKRLSRKGACSEDGSHKKYYENIFSDKDGIENKSRDVSEKLFRGDKSYLGNKSIRVYSEESARAKIFVEFVAMIVRCKMYIKLKEEMKKLDKKLNYMTVPAAIKELEKIEMVRQLDNIYRLDHAVTANQKVILKAFGLDANSIKYFASELSKELKEAE